MNADIEHGLKIVERHMKCADGVCRIHHSFECGQADQLRPFANLVLAIRAEVTGFDRAEFGGLYTRLRDIHILLNEPEDES